MRSASLAEALSAPLPAVPRSAAPSARGSVGLGMPLAVVAGANGAISGWRGTYDWRSPRRACRVRARLHLGRRHDGGRRRRQRGRHACSATPATARRSASARTVTCTPAGCSSARDSRPPSATSSPAPATSPGHAGPSSSPTTRTCTCGRRAGSVPPTRPVRAAGWRAAPWPAPVVWATVRRDAAARQGRRVVRLLRQPVRVVGVQPRRPLAALGMVDRLGWKQPAVQAVRQQAATAVSGGRQPLTMRSRRARMSATSCPTRARPCAPCPDRASDRSGARMPSSSTSSSVRAIAVVHATHRAVAARSRRRRRASWMSISGGSTGIAGIALLPQLGVPRVAMAGLGEQPLQVAWRGGRRPTPRAVEELEVARPHAAADSVQLDDAEPVAHEREPARQALRRRRGRSPARRRRCTRAASPGTVRCTSSLPRIALTPHTTRSRITKLGRHVELLDHAAGAGPGRRRSCRACRASTRGVNVNSSVRYGWYGLLT